MLDILAPSKVSMMTRMGLLVAITYLLSMTYGAGALDIMTEDSGLVKSGWIEYSSSVDKLPQCCASDSCRMVRISPDLMDKTKMSLNMRVTMMDKDAKMNIIVSYDSELEGMVGLVYRRNGIVQFLRPLTLEERTEEPCFIAKLAGNMGTFHKLSLQGEKDGVMPKFLFRPTLASHSNPVACCSENACTLATELKMEFLKFGTEKSPDIYIPRHTLPSEDLSEVFSLTSTQPSSCMPSLCDIYLYHNSNKELLKISVTGDTIMAILETEGASPDMVLKQCNGDYVWTEKREQKEKTSNAEAIQSTSLAATAVKAAPGLACWYPQDYCDPLHHVINYFDEEEEGNREELVLQCYEFCHVLADCAYFTYFSMRGKGTCYLLSDCKRTSDTCLSLGHCKSGPSDCTPLHDNGDCAPPPDLGDGYNKWQCIDTESEKLGPVQQNTTLPPGTICLQSCGAWRTEARPGRPQTTGYLESRCQDSGQWSETLPFNGDAALEFPIGPYPAPDAAKNATVQPLSCGCEPLVLDYNPNIEEGAEFVCKREVSWDGYQFTIATGNECHLWCDGVLAITVKCSEDGWTGEPIKEGVWCYKEPEPGCKCGLANRKERIVGGQETEVNEYPWQAGLIYFNLTGNGNWDNQPTCGGCLISDQWVVTAAHCITTFDTPKSEIQVFLGYHDFFTTVETESIRATISDIFIHEDYSSIPLNSTQYPIDRENYDFALLKLTNPIDFAAYPNIRPICLPENTNKDYSGLSATVTGWGLTSWNSSAAVPGQRSNVLRDVDVTVWDNSKCEEDYKLLTNFTDQMLCANVPEGGKGTCMFDGGNPLVTSGDGDGVTPGQNFEIIGVSSWGIPCAMPEYPGVYARITRGLDWIRDRTSSAWNTCPGI